MLECDNNNKKQSETDEDIEQEENEEEYKQPKVDQNFITFLPYFYSM